MSIKLRRWEEREQTRTGTEKMKQCLILSRETFYVTIVEITARHARTSLRKRNVIKVCSTEYLTTEIELVLPTFKSWTVHKIIEINSKGPLNGL